MDVTAGRRPDLEGMPSGALEVKIPPLTLKSIGEMYGHKDVEETRVYLQSVKGRKDFLADEIYGKIPGAREAYNREGRDMMQELDDVYNTFESKESWLGKTWNFVKRHKGKIILGTLAAAAAFAGFNYWSEIKDYGAQAVDNVRQWGKEFIGVDKLENAAEEAKTYADGVAQEAQSAAENARLTAEEAMRKTTEGLKPIAPPIEILPYPAEVPSPIQPLPLDDALKNLQNLRQP